MAKDQISDLLGTTEKALSKHLSLHHHVSLSKIYWKNQQEHPQPPSSYSLGHLLWKCNSPWIKLTAIYCNDHYHILEKINFFKHESLGSQAISKNVKYQFCYPDKYSKQFLPLLQIPRFFILSIFLHVHIRDAGLVGEFSDKFSGRNFSHKVCRKILRQVSWEKKWRILVSIYKNENSLFLHPSPQKIIIWKGQRRGGANHQTSLWVEDRFAEEHIKITLCLWSPCTFIRVWHNVQLERCFLKVWETITVEGHKRR